MKLLKARASVEMTSAIDAMSESLKVAPRRMGAGKEVADVKLASGPLPQLTPGLLPTPC